MFPIPIAANITSSLRCPIKTILIYTINNNENAERVTVIEILMRFRTIYDVVSSIYCSF